MWQANIIIIKYEHIILNNERKKSDRALKKFRMWGHFTELFLTVFLRQFVLIRHFTTYLQVRQLCDTILSELLGHGKS